MSTILVTGDTGFIGNTLVRELLHEGHHVIGVSRSTEVDSDLQKVQEYTHIASDMASLSSKRVGERIEAFIDLAWAGSSGAARGDKMLQHTNVENAVKNVKLAAALGASLYLGVGTITEVTALAEDASAGPATTYGLSKHLAHQETKKAAKELGIDHIWARLGNTYSEEDTSGRFLDATLRKLAADEDVELLTGNQPFDFIHLTDAVRAIHLLSFAGVSGETYYVGNGDVATIEDFVLVAGNILNSKSHIKSHFVDKLGLTAEDLSNEAIVELGYNQDVSFIQGVKLWKEYNRS